MFQLVRLGILFSALVLTSGNNSKSDLYLLKLDVCMLLNFDYLMEE